MEVRKILVVTCLFVVVACGAGKKVKAKPENLEDTYGDLLDEDVQNDNNYEYATGDDEAPPDEDNGVVGSEEQAEFLTSPKTITANIGETVMLPCEVSNNDVVVIWQKGDVLLFQSGVPIDKASNIKEHKNNTLQIRLDKTEDFGDYACVLMTTNDAKSRPKIVHHVMAFTAPNILGITTNKNNQTVYKIGETMTLTCIATGHPKPTISWHKGNERLEVTGEALTISNLKIDDAGPYRCLADNQVSNENSVVVHHKPSHAYLQISIEHPPRLSVKEYLVTSKKEKNAELTCMVDAYPQAAIEWKKGGETLLNEGKVQMKLNRKQKGWESVLFINDLSDDDFTNYTCVANNNLGSTQQTINLVKVPVVREFVKPEKGNKDVVLTWKVESSSAITAHEIQYRKKGETSWKEAKPEVTVSDSNIYTVKYTLKDLDAGAYETRLRSQSEHGWSEYSSITPFEGVLAKHGSSTHKNHHKKHHKEPKEKDLKEKHNYPAQEATTSVLQQQEIVQKEAPVGASQTGSSSSAASSMTILSIALIFLYSIRQ